MHVREHRDELVGRVWLLHVVAAALLLFVAGWYWFVQVVEGPGYRELAENNRLRRLPLVAPRGLVFDRHGELLVEIVPSYNLMLERFRSRDLAASLAFAAGVLGVEPASLTATLERARGVSPYAPVLVAEGLSLGEVARFGVAALEQPEFTVEVNALRLYRHGPQTAHVLGHSGEVGSDASDRGLAPGTLVGKRGIEESYDAWLRGEDGEKVVVVDSRSRLVAEYGERPARPGRNLTLTLDLALQQEAERQMRGKVGAVVALDPRDGAVLAMVSAPTYNPNVFSRQLAEREWQQILATPHQPLQNRAIQNTHSPGSVFKAVMGIAGLEEGLVSPEERVTCTGVAVFYDRPFRCHKVGGHGSVDLREALKVSCDVYFYHLGRRLGIERIARWARRFGMGALTGIDLVGEKRGLVPDSAWSLAVRKAPWYAGETISVAIGQGPILATPLQIAVQLAMFANGGHPVRPHLVAPQDRRERPAPVAVAPSSLTVVNAGLFEVVGPGGTAAIAALPGIAIAGKTGTVQVTAQSARTDNDTLPWELRDHAWFASFASGAAAHAQPPLVVVVFVEHGGHGSAAAAPIAKALYATHYASSRHHLDL